MAWDLSIALFGLGANRLAGYLSVCILYKGKGNALQYYIEFMF